MPHRRVEAGPSAGLRQDVSKSKGRDKGLPDQAQTVISAPPSRGATTIPDLTTATVPIPIPKIDVPPHAARILARQTTEYGEHRQTQYPKVGGYAVIARFPSSASADVFLGHKITDFGFLRRVVLKWVDRQRPDYGRAHRTLSDEARAIAGLDHPNIVSLLDFSVDAYGTQLAIEYVSGTDLRRATNELTHRKSRLPISQACFIVCEVLRGLHHVHTAIDPFGRPLSIVHRDVNPSNVLLGDDGRVKLTDFGTVYMMGRSQEETAPGRVKGKVRYLAPEYITDQRCTHQVDIYSVGVMFYELILSQHSFEGATNAEVMVKIVRNGLSYQVLQKAQVPSELIRIIRRATDRTPSRRYEKASDMMSDLENFLKVQGWFTSPRELGLYLQEERLFF